MQFVVEQQLGMDKPSSSFGNLLAATLKKSYTLVNTQMEKWLPTRFLAAQIDINDQTCAYFLNQAVDASTSKCNVDEVCSQYKFDDLESLYHFAFANKDASEKDWVLENTQMSKDEFTALYDTKVATSLGSAIATVDTLAATTYKCKNVNLCTPEELTMKQWLSSEITMDIPTDFEGNEFLNVDGETCLSKAWKLDDEQNTNFPCSEFTSYKGEIGDISAETYSQIFNIDGKSKVSLDNEIRASKVMSYVSLNDKSGQAATDLNSIYMTDDIYQFVTMMRNMVETYLLKGPCKQVTLGDLVFGYDEPSIQMIHEQMSIYEGKEVALSSFVNTVLTENSTSSKE